MPKNGRECCKEQIRDLLIEQFVPTFLHRLPEVQNGYDEFTDKIMQIIDNYQVDGNIL